MLHFSMVHLLLVFAVVLLLFGPKKLPELARGLGQGMKEFKHAMHEVTSPVEEPPGAAAPTASRPAQSAVAPPQSPSSA
jgi:sec-independent protein translocase protein TatA